MFDYGWNFQSSLQAFLDSIFGFVNGLLNSVFGFLAALFDSLNVF